MHETHTRTLEVSGQASFARHANVRSIEASGFIEAGGPIEAGGFIEAGGSIAAGEFIEAGGPIEASESIKAGEFALSLDFEIRCKSLATKILPFWRSYYAAMPPLAEFAVDILDEENCWKELQGKVSTEKAIAICSWEGWHPIIRAHLQMFFGLREEVPGEELVVVAG